MERGRARPIPARRAPLRVGRGDRRADRAGTGGSAGIGRAIAERLRQEGATVVVADIDPAAAADGPFLEVDVTDPGAVERMIAHAEPTILVNNAGGYAEPVFALERAGEPLPPDLATDLIEPEEVADAVVRFVEDDGLAGRVLSLPGREPPRFL